MDFEILSEVIIEILKIFDKLRSVAVSVILSIKISLEIEKMP
jgi:hypothetical protein